MIVNLLDPTQNAVWANFVLFAIGGAAIGFAGTRLERAADTISRKTRLGDAFAGLVLLAFATSLPEIATTTTAALRGNATLAVNNLMGGIAMQTALLAIADFTVARGALTSFTPNFGLLLQGVGLVLLLATALVGFAAGELFSVFGVGFWPIALVVGYVLLLRQMRAQRGDPRWEPATPEAAPGPAAPDPHDEAPSAPDPRRALRGAAISFAGFAVLILAAGFLVTRVAEALTEQLGWNASFVGAVLVAIATSLPELSTTTAAARNRNYTMAISNIFGTNMIEVALLFWADLFYRGGPIVEAGGEHATFMAALGLFVTAIYLWGLLLRRKRTIARLGLDSALVLGAYLAGVYVLYKMD